MARRKPTTQEALDKLKTLPDFPAPVGVGKLPPALRPIATIPFIFDQGGKAIARLLIRADPLNRLDDTTAEIINNPNVVADEVGNILELIEPARESGVGFALPSKSNVKKAQKLTKKVKMQRKIQSKAFKNANAKGRKQNGEFRSGFDQSRIARMAQKECTSERIRLGLCEDPKKKKKGTRKGQVRKTARRAFEK